MICRQNIVELHSSILFCLKPGLVRRGQLITNGRVIFKLPDAAHNVGYCSYTILCGCYDCENFFKSCYQFGFLINLCFVWHDVRFVLTTNLFLIFDNLWSEQYTFVTQCNSCNTTQGGTKKWTVASRGLKNAKYFAGYGSVLMCKLSSEIAL